MSNNKYKSAKDKDSDDEDNIYDKVDRLIEEINGDQNEITDTVDLDKSDKLDNLDETSLSTQLDQNQLEPIQTQTAVPEKKKRGRKPKPKPTDLAQTSTESSTNDGQTNPTNPTNTDPNMSNPDSNPVQPDSSSIMKKRGRKSSNNKLIQINVEHNVSNMDSLIACLPLKISDVAKVISDASGITTIPEEKSTKINPTIDKVQLPNKYVDFVDDHMDFHINSKSKNSGPCQKCVVLEDKITKLQEEVTHLKNGIIYNSTNLSKKIYESKVNLINKTSGKWEERTDIVCWWCCHKFDHIPVGIPEYITKEKIYLSGNFCSFNCKMAYNLDLNDYKIWDRQANIYQLKNIIDPENNIVIHPAPPRQTLKMFGGPLSIEEFRESFFILNREFRYFIPPMVSIIGIIEEDNRDTTEAGTKIRLNKSSNPMIQRKKPLPKSNCLNSIINKI